MSGLRMIYLALTVAGTILPMRYFLQWFGENGFDIMGMVDAWHANAASSGLVWDLTVSAAALVVWMCAEVYQRKDYWVLALCLPATFGIGVSCGLPLYLFLRARSVT
ncbi:DUF2834 domain-containing protein [Neptunicoccus cionae]|uniref:DUF2834 domain-containing protein n=1 Tax=Neptunicoccus cionae TaxID=2035344 RepID=UPI000C77E1AE|nr:DUF2834 domain-containing protein [Amylibacter cionae]PLS23128.1 K+-transporting ATPase, A chain [Amylibacter cionae]